MLSVGGLAAVVNVVVLVTVGIADRALSIAVRNFASTRLQRERHAPIVHDSDTWLPNVPRSLFKYRKYPFISVAVLCSVFLVVSEVITEIGVDVSDKCDVHMESGRVIPKGNIVNRVTDIELGASAMVVNRMEFIEDFVRVPAGMPKLLRGSECVTCLDDRVKYPDIVSGCSVTQGRTYQPGELEVTIVRTDGAFGTVTKSFKELGGQRRTFEGMGDVTGNGEYRASFIFTNNAQPDAKLPSLLYIEYASQSHVNSMYNSVAPRDVPIGTEVTSRTETPVSTHVISCDVNVFSHETFLEVTMIYRMIQLESQMQQLQFHPRNHSFASLSSSDVLRAVLSAKVMDDDEEKLTGDFYRYSICGRYNWQYILPFACCLGAILLLALISVLSRYGRGEVARKIPHNSRSWFRRALATEMEVTSTWSENNGDGLYFDPADEMLLIEEGIGAPRQRIVLRSALETAHARHYETAFDKY